MHLMFKFASISNNINIDYINERSKTMNEKVKGEKIGLGLSGGGYRATLFNLGGLIRLNELGVLSKLHRITSVSGGSIVNGYLAMRWNDLKFDENGVATNFHEIIVEPMWEFCSKPLDVCAVLTGLLNPFRTIGDQVTKAYNKRLYNHHKMSEIKNGNQAPQFLFYGTSMQNGASVRFMRNQMYNYKIGAIEIDQLELAKVVCISSAFPPFFSPVILKLNPDDWVESKIANDFNSDQTLKFRKRFYLTDGGVYDNMGMESLWKHYDNELKSENERFRELLIDDIDIALISDAGALLKYKTPWKNWISMLQRTLSIITDQARSVRKRYLIFKFKDECDPLTGSYWGLSSKLKNYKYDTPIDISQAVVDKLKNVPTRLDKFSDETKGELINWGYALGDVAVRKHKPHIIVVEPEPKLPYPEYPLNK